MSRQRSRVADLTGALRRVLRQSFASRRRLRATAREAVRGVKPLFDASHYRSTCPDAPDAPEAALEHYLRSPVCVDHKPNSVFDGVWYLSRYPDVAASGLHPLLHYARFGARENRWPAPSFDPEWYSRRNPEAAAYSSPLEHYLSVGRRLGLRTAPDLDASYLGVPEDELLDSRLRRIFDAKFYVVANPDVAEAGVDALDHFLAHGLREARRPNAFFDADFYRAAYPDVADAGIAPLQHYLLKGWREGRNPGPEFDHSWYLARYPDVARSGFNPLEHHLHIGIPKGRHPIRWYDPGAYLPVVEGTEAARGEPRRVAVVVPVYDGLEETKDCIQSLLAWDGRCELGLVLVDDASPNLELRRYLDRVSADPRVVLLRNKKNLGFVRSANRGLAACPDLDAVLLNSDTVVSGDWLDRLASHAHSADDIATVTPFSNNATICSYPRLDRANDLPEGLEPATLDSVFASVNAGRSVEIPTAVGFCMYVKRDCLDEIGVLNEEEFGRGYGEENDLCMRASARGWRHLLAADVFVYHAGGVSFGAESNERSQAAQRVLARLHPEYSQKVQQHLILDPGRPFRDAVTARLLKEGKRRVLLAISHGVGGGTDKHLQESAEANSNTDCVILLSPFGRSMVRLTSASADIELDVRLNPERDLAHLAAFLKSAGVARVHIHHVLGLPRVRELVEMLGLPFDFTAHDYYAICPRLRLARRHRYCGERGVADCQDCLGEQPPAAADDIIEWRSSNAWLLTHADRVLCPSRDVETRLRRHESGAALVFAPHQDGADATHLQVVRPMQPTRRLRIATLGALSRDKGADRFIQCAVESRKLGLPLEFRLLGFAEPRLPARNAADLVVTGPYDDKDLPRLIAEAAPDVVWFPAQWPETFSYVLSAAFKAGLPVVVPDLGAFPERVAGRPWSWVVPWDTQPDEMAQWFSEIRRQYFIPATPPPRARHPDAPRATDSSRTGSTRGGNRGSGRSRAF